MFSQSALVGGDDRPILTGKDYLALPRDPHTWLIRSLLPIGGTLLLYGDPKVGKSYLGIQLALAIQAGTAWLGFDSVVRGPVVYVQLDTPRSLWADRMQQLRDSGLPEVDNLLLADRETLQTWPFDILNRDHWSMLRGAIAPYNPVAVVIDTLREANRNEENSSTEMKEVVSQLVACCQPAALVLIHHARKASHESEPNLIDDARGGYSVGAVDGICRLTKKGLHFIGRALEEGSIKVSRAENGLWHQDSQEETAQRQHTQEILQDPTLTTTRDRARLLAIKLGKSEEAARSILRRAVGDGL